MTEYGVTPTGFKAKPFSVLQEELQTAARSAFGSEDLDTISPEGFLSSVYQPINARHDAIWKLMEIIYNAPDPRRSTGQSYEAVAALRGVTRKPATRGYHNDPGVSATFDAAVAGSILRGAVRFHPEGSPENVWMNSNDFTVGGAGGYAMEAESELSGSDKVLNLGAAIVILDGPSALSSITVPEGAVSGTDIEPEVTWRVRSEAAISEEQTPVGEAVEAIPNVTSARVVETPGYIRVIVNDLDTAADDDDIAQAIQDSKCAGIVALGSESGSATDGNGEIVTVPFERAELVPCTATATVTSINGFSSAAVKTAIQAAQPALPGRPVVWSDLFAAVKGVEGVDDLALTIAKSPDVEGVANLSGDVDHLLNFSDVDITVITV